MQLIKIVVITKALNNECVRRKMAKRLNLLKGPNKNTAFFVLNRKI